MRHRSFRIGAVGVCGDRISDGSFAQGSKIWAEGLWQDSLGDEDRVDAAAAQAKWILSYPHYVAYNPMEDTLLIFGDCFFDGVPSRALLIVGKDSLNRSYYTIKAIQRLDDGRFALCCKSFNLRMAVRNASIDNIYENFEPSAVPGVRK